MSNSVLADWNGSISPLASLSVPVQDRAFFFGDGVYEVLRVYKGRPFLLREHMKRLEHSLDRVSLDLTQEASPAVIEQRLLASIARNKVTLGTVYLQVSRGTAPRSHAFPAHASPNILIYAQDLADPVAALRAGGASVITTSDLRWAWCDVKSTNLLPNTLARQLAAEAGALEALFIGRDGLLTEGAASNVFLVKNGELVTPPANERILWGVTRQHVLNLARSLGLAATEREVKGEELAEADEVFLTSTSAEVLGVTKIDGRSVGSSRVGPVTERLAAAFKLSVG